MHTKPKSRNSNQKQIHTHPHVSHSLWTNGRLLPIKINSHSIRDELEGGQTWLQSFIQCDYWMFRVQLLSLPLSFIRCHTFLASLSMVTSPTLTIYLSKPNFQYEQSSWEDIFVSVWPVDESSLKQRHTESVHLLNTLFHWFIISPPVSSRIHQMERERKKTTPENFYTDTRDKSSNWVHKLHIFFYYSSYGCQPTSGKNLIFCGHFDYYFQLFLKLDYGKRISVSFVSFRLEMAFRVKDCHCQCLAIEFS